MSPVRWFLNRERKPSEFFEVDGFRRDFSPMTDLVNGSHYILFHRGNPALNRDLITVKETNASATAFYDSQPFIDGAWALFKVENLNVFGQTRDWEDPLYKARQQIHTEMLGIRNGF